MLTSRCVAIVACFLGWLLRFVPRLRTRQVSLACTGFENTELGVFMGPEVSHGETKVYAGLQA